jgi:hypothetical protein
LDQAAQEAEEVAQIPVIHIRYEWRALPKVMVQIYCRNNAMTYGNFRTFDELVQLNWNPVNGILTVPVSETKRVVLRKQLRLRYIGARL